MATSWWIDAAGCWSRAESPVVRATGGELGDCLTAAGYVALDAYGPSASTGLTVEWWASPDGPHCLVLGTTSLIWDVHTADLPSALAGLRQLLPLVEAAEKCGELARDAAVRRG